MFNNYHFGLFYFFCDVIFYLCVGNEDGGGQLVYESACCLVWGVILKEGKIEVLFVSSLFLTRVGVYVCVCECIRTHTHTLWGTWM